MIVHCRALLLTEVNSGGRTILRIARFVFDSIANAVFAAVSWQRRVTFSGRRLNAATAGSTAFAKSIKNIEIGLENALAAYGECFYFYLLHGPQAPSIFINASRLIAIHWPRWHQRPSPQIEPSAHGMCCVRQPLMSSPHQSRPHGGIYGHTIDVRPNTNSHCLSGLIYSPTNVDVLVVFSVKSRTGLSRMQWPWPRLRIQKKKEHDQLPLMALGWSFTQHTQWTMDMQNTHSKKSVT